MTRGNFGKSDGNTWQTCENPWESPPKVECKPLRQRPERIKERTWTNFNRFQSFSHVMHIQAPASFTCTWMRSIADNKFSTFEMRIDSLEENQIYSNINLMCLSVYLLTLISFQVKHWRWFGIIAFIPRSWRWCSWRLSSFSHSNPCAKTASHSPLTLWSNTKSSMIGKNNGKTFDMTVSWFFFVLVLDDPGSNCSVDTEVLSKKSTATPASGGGCANHAANAFWRTSTCQCFGAHHSSIAPSPRMDRVHV